MIVFILYLVYDLVTNIIACFFFIGNIDPKHIIIKLIYKYTNIYFN